MHHLTLKPSLMNDTRSSSSALTVLQPIAIDRLSPHSIARHLEFRARHHLAELLLPPQSCSPRAYGRPPPVRCPHAAAVPSIACPDAAGRQLSPWPPRLARRPTAGPAAPPRRGGAGSGSPPAAARRPAPRWSPATQAAAPRSRQQLRRLPPPQQQQPRMQPPLRRPGVASWAASSASSSVSCLPAPRRMRHASLPASARRLPLEPRTPRWPTARHHLDAGDGLDRSKLASLGMGAFASYGAISNVTYCTCLTM
jgi:hypothetical protein